MINDHIKSYGAYRIPIEIEEIDYTEGTEYTFTNGTILEILKEHYEPLGYTVNFSKSGYLNIVINKPSPVSSKCKCIII